MVAATWKVLCGMETRIAECIGIRMGMQLAKDLCFQDIEVETDYLEAYNALRYSDESPSYFHAIARDCLLLGCEF